MAFQKVEAQRTGRKRVIVLAGFSGVCNFLGASGACLAGLLYFTRLDNPNFVDVLWAYCAGWTLAMFALGLLFSRMASRKLDALVRGVVDGATNARKVATPSPSGVIASPDTSQGASEARPAMTLQFQSSATEQAHATIHFWEESPALRAHRRVDAGMGALVIAGVVYAISPGAWQVRAGLAVGAFALAAAAVLLRSASEAKIKRLEALYREGLGEAPIDCEVGVSQQGLTSRERGRHERVEWSEVRRIEESTTGVEIVFANSLLHIPHAAFSSAQQRSDFLALARSYAQPSLAPA